MGQLAATRLLFAYKFGSSRPDKGRRAARRAQYDRVEASPDPAEAAVGWWEESSSSEALVRRQAGEAPFVLLAHRQGTRRNPEAA